MVKTLRISLQERVRCNDSTNIPETNLPRSSNGSPVVSAEIHREPAHDDRHCRVGAGRDEKKCAVLKVVIVVRGDEYCETSDTDTYRNKREEEAMAQFIAKKCDEHAEAERGSPRWDAV